MSNHGGRRPGAGRPRKAYSTPKFKQPASDERLTIGREAFTEPEIEILSASPHVRKVTEKTISYTPEFKALFWEKYEAGNSPPDIFEEAGFDLDILGDSRIFGLLTAIRREKVIAEQTEKIASQGSAATSNKKIIGEINEKEIRKLMHQVAYMSQELEFIKKIMKADGTVN
jgi:hypothetical protein